MAHLKHELGIGRLGKRLDRVETADGRSVHVATEERDTDLAVDLEDLHLLYEPIALLLVVRGLCLNRQP